jgi:PAS domain S-box-containing protein
VRAKAYAISIVALVAAVLLRWALDPLIGDTLPLVTLFGAVAVAVWIGGYRPAAIVAVLGYLACNYLFILPRNAFSPFNAQNVVGMIAYVFTCALIVAIGEAMRSARERAHAEAASRMRGARLLASIVESSDDAIISKSLDGVIESWNAAAERVFGYAAKDAIGRHITLVIPPDRIAEEDQIIASIKAGRRVEHFETERVRGDGERILVSLTISPVKDEAGNIIGASKIVRDVTRQRQAEERERGLLAEAAAANAKFRALFDQGALFAGILDLDGTILEQNRRFVEGCGYTRAQVSAKRLWEGPWWTPSAALVDRIRAGCEKAGTGEAFRAELPYFVAGGSERIIDLAIFPIKDDAGRILFLAATGADITDRKRAEAERERLEEDLRKLANDLSEADRRKDEFLATLAHELRNPLAPLRNMLEILKRAGSDPTRIPQALETMERQLGHLVRLVDDLLDLNRITHNRIELRKEPVEIGALVAQVVQATRPLAEASGHELRVSGPAEPIRMEADPVRLSQIFGNLLNNSCKYTRPGGKIDVTVERQGTDAVVKVRDNGIGIPADKIDSIFDMFNQVDQSFADAQGGLGIGLALVKQLVEMHGGSVHASSGGTGRGSEFVVRLPIGGEDAAAAGGGKARALETTHARRILVVDDNHDAATSLAALLQINGNEAFTAHDGPAAIEAIEKHRPEVVLLDIGLPRLNGYEVCRRVRAQPWGRDMMLIALTGWGQEEDRRTSDAAGFDGHLVKPVEYATLTTMVDSLAAARKGRMGV